MSLPRFMSREHIEHMNTLLDGELHEECAALHRAYVMQYDVVGDPEGARTWTFTASPSGVRFAVDQPVPQPDMQMALSYQEMAASAEAGRTGAEPPGYENEPVIHDPEGFHTVMTFLELARPIGTVEVRFG